MDSDVSRVGARFGVYLCPAAASDLYKVGSKVVGFDLRAGFKVAPIEELRRDWGFPTDPGGFRLPLVEGLYTDPVLLPKIEAEVRACVQCLAPGAVLSLSNGRVEVSGQSWQWRMDPSPALLVLHTLLSARLARFVTESVYDQDLDRLNWLEPHEQTRLELLRTPYGLDTWQPAFPLLSQFKGEQPAAVQRAIERQLGYWRTMNFEAVTMVEKPRGEARWQVRTDIELPSGFTFASAAEHLSNHVPLPPHLTQDEEMPGAAEHLQAHRAPLTHLVIATQNRGKVREMATAFAPLGCQIHELGGVPLPPETGSTYEENAALKACAAALATGMPALADDSGLEVRALGGEPGVYSARFGNLNSDNERNVYLLQKLRDKDNRRAKFVSVLVLAYPDGGLEYYRGEVHGQLLEGPRGEQGFGYDPLFVPDGETRTMAELSTDEKQRISHRGQAIAALIQAHQKRELAGG